MTDKADQDKEYAFVDGPEDHNALFGSAAIGTYIVVWICSLASPVFVGRLVFKGDYSKALGLLAFIATAYTPLWRTNTWVKNLISLGSRRYFKKASLKYVGGQHPDCSGQNPTVLCVHPHGIFCLGWGMLFSRPELAEMRFCFSPALYTSPFFRMFCSLTGKPAPADKKSFLALMNKRTSIALIPGGFEEASLTCNTTERIYLKKRAGFLKYAMMNGYSLTPCYVFGENRAFYNVQGAFKFRLWLNSLGLPAIVPFGRWFFPLLPRNDGLHVVVGKPMPLAKVDSPTPDQVKVQHEKYIAVVKQLFEDHKADYGVKGELEVW